MPQPPSPPQDVALLVGSLRENGFSSQLARRLTELAAPWLALRLVPIGGLPLYNQDLDGAPPAPWLAFRDAIRPAAAVLFVTPEYNRSLPGALKNALDIGSRPYGKSVFAGKPAAVVSCSPGALGGFGSNHALRQSLVFLDMPVLQQPEMYLGHIDTALEALYPQTLPLLRGFLDRFAAWITRNPARQS